MRSRLCICRTAAAVIASLAIGFCNNVARAADSSSIVDVSADYNAADVLTSHYISGDFSVVNGQVHCWANDYYYGAAGYRIIDIATGDATTVGNSSVVVSNGYGDPFGVYDSANGVFYVGTYDWSGSGAYSYTASSGTWASLGVFNSLYDGEVYDGRLYVSGLNAIWNGSTGQDNQIAVYDSASSSYDVLIQATGNSACLAVDNNGNVYYANYGENPTLYRWSASQVASVMASEGNGSSGGDETDAYLTYADAEILCALGAGANGIAVDDGGNVFVSVNDGSSSELIMWNATMGDDYELIATLDSSIYYGWFGYIDTEGDFLNGGTVYMSNYGSTGLVEITSNVPEPTTLCLLAGGSVLALLRRRNRGVRSAKPARRSAGRIGRGANCLLAAAALLLAGASVQAGVYSPGKGGEAEASYIDAGIAGFVGLAGEGVTATSTNGNYVNPIFVGWATGYSLYQPSDAVGTYGMNGIGSQFGNPTLATGEVTGNVMDIVSLGDMSATEISAYLAGTGSGPGTLVLTFDYAITNGEGADFAAFENGFVSNYTTGAGSTAGTMFAELGYVEVSTDGVNYARFPSVYSNYPDGEGLPSSTAYLTQDVSNIYNLAGKHANAYGVSWGTPFDLDDLLDNELVLAGLVDLNEINYVRIVDIPGDGTFTDSLGNSIYDAWVTWGSGGMDFEALGVIHQVPEPVTLAMLAIGGVGLLVRKRRKNS